MSWRRFQDVLKMSLRHLEDQKIFAGCKNEDENLFKEEKMILEILSLIENI